MPTIAILLYIKKNVSKAKDMFLYLEFFRIKFMNKGTMIKRMRVTVPPYDLQYSPTTVKNKLPGKRFSP